VAARQIEEQSNASFIKTIHVAALLRKLNCNGCRKPCSDVVQDSDNVLKFMRYCVSEEKMRFLSQTNITADHTETYEKQ
jgi:hypothetical protein